MDTSTIRKQNIYKRYDLIYSAVPSTFGDNELKLINVLHKEAQKIVGNCNEKNSKYPTTHQKIEINISDIAKMMKVDKNKNQHTTVKNSLQKLKRHTIELRNFIHPISGAKYDWWDTSIVLEYSKLINSRSATVTLSEFFLLAVWRRNKYVTIDTNATSSFKSKYTIRLYEAMMFQISKRKDKYIDMNLEILNQIFMSPTNKYLSVIQNKINRYNIQEDMKKWLDFSYQLHKKDKIITFKINDFIDPKKIND